MVGRSLTDRFPNREPHVGEVCFEVKDWCVDHPVFDGIKVCDHINFNLRRGEVLGISGLMGAGRTELAMSIFGHSYGANIRGHIYKNGKEVSFPNVKSAIKAGLAYVTEDRKGNGLILTESICKNTTAAKPEKISNHYILDFDKERKYSEEMAKEMHTKCASVMEDVGNLSGGNMQKVLLGKWLFAEPEILILDEPTSGLDPNQVEDVRNIIREIGKTRTVIVSTHILSEVETICSRAIIISSGKVVADSPIEELKERFGHELSVNITVGGGSFDDISAAIKAVSGVDSVTQSADNNTEIENAISIHVSVNGSAEIRPALCKAITEKGYDLYEVSMQRNSLEDVFHALTTANGEEEGK